MYCCAISKFDISSKIQKSSAAPPYFRRWKSVKLVRDAFLNKLPFLLYISSIVYDSDNTNIYYISTH
jgi:hypothetical protein